MFSVKPPVPAMGPLLLAVVFSLVVFAGCSGQPAQPGNQTPAASASNAASATAAAAADSDGPTSAASNAASPVGGAEPFVVTAAEASALLAAGALAVDGRGSGFASGHIAGAVPLTWEETCLPRSGILRSPSEVRALLGLRAIDPRRTLVVYGGKDTWGAEGRVFWTLEFYGAPSVRFLNGGIEAWRAAGLATANGEAPAAPNAAEIAAEWESLTPGSGRALMAEVVHHGERKTWQFVDARTKAEFGGKVLYGEPRGGRLPGACWIEYLAVQNADGTLKTPAEIRAMAEAAGIVTGKPVVTYCSGGVRSGLLYVALRYAGYDAKNYPGSMWEYTADPSLPVEKD